MKDLTLDEIVDGFYFGYSNVDLFDEAATLLLLDAFRNKEKRSVSQAKKQLKGILCKKISLLPTPVCVLHSSGVDSTLMLLLARECFECKDIVVQRIGFLESRYDESTISEMLCKGLGIDGSTEVIGASNVWDTLSSINSDNYKNWFHTSSLIPTKAAMESAKEMGSSILTGDGGDEVFCGYDRFVFMKYMSWVRLFGGILKKLTKVRTDRDRKFMEFLSFGYKGFVSYWSLSDLQIMFPDCRPGTCVFDRVMKIADGSGLCALEKHMFLDICTELFGVEKQKVDTAVRMAMNPTVCSPLMDLDTILFCASLPLDMKYRGFTRKWLLRDMINDMFPEYKNIVKRKKKGFAAPLGEWLRLDPSLRALCCRVMYQGKKRLDVMYREHMFCEMDHSPQLWSLLVWDALSSRGAIQS